MIGTEKQIDYAQKILRGACVYNTHKLKNERGSLKSYEEKLNLIKLIEHIEAGEHDEVAKMNECDLPFWAYDVIEKKDNEFVVKASAIIEYLKADFYSALDEFLIDRDGNPLKPAGSVIGTDKQTEYARKILRGAHQYNMYMLNDAMEKKNSLADAFKERLAMIEAIEHIEAGQHEKVVSMINERRLPFWAFDIIEKREDAFVVKAWGAINHFKSDFYNALNKGIIDSDGNPLVEIAVPENDDCEQDSQTQQTQTCNY